MICSMTAYAREVVTSPLGDVSWEVRSVNHRYLELYFKLPEEFRDLEYSLRELGRKTVARGKIDCVLKIDHKSTASPELELNMQAAHGLIAACNKISESLKNVAPISPLEIIKWPGVIITPEQNQVILSDCIKQCFIKVMDSMIQARKNEGSQLLGLIIVKLESIVQQINNLQQQMPIIVAQYRQKLIDKITDLNLSLDQNRFEQELVYLLQKSDITEEIDRLNIHAVELKHVCANGGTVGRKLDFLLQEMNREANTIASKSIANLTSTAAIELKVLIEQIKEQVQNLE